MTDYVEETRQKIQGHIDRAKHLLRVKLIPEWRNEHLPGMRQYRRMLVQKVIKDIRYDRMNLKDWEAIK
jgi:hypothetical protein